MHAFTAPLVAAALALVGCSGLPPESDAGPRRTNDSAAASGQLLHIDDDPGGISITRPPVRGSWWGSFGGRLMCSDDPVRIEQVRPEWTVMPVRAEFYVRTVDRSAMKAGPVSSIFYSMLGRAPRFAETYAGDGAKPGGDFVLAEGAVIDGECDITGRYQEFVLSVESGPEGADLTRIQVDYSGERGDGSIDLGAWRTVSCGSNSRVRDVCRSP